MAMCGVQLKDGNGVKDLMLVLGLSKIIGHWLWQAVCVGMVMC